MPFSFTSQGRLRNSLDQQHRHAIAEIEARKRAELDLQREALALQRTESDIAAVTKQKEIMAALKTVAKAANPGLGEDQLNALVDNQYAQFVASDPQAVTSQNLASSAINQVKRGQAEGALPLAGTSGRKAAQADILASTAAEAENLNRYNVARERSTTAPLLSSALDFESQERALLGGEIAQGTRPFGRQLAETQAKSGIATGKKEIAQNEYETAEFGKLDPALAAESKMAGFGSAKANADLNTRSGGLLGVTNPFAGIGGQMILADPVIQRIITSALTNAPPAVASPGALVPRHPGIWGTQQKRRNLRDILGAP